MVFTGHVNLAFLGFTLYFTYEHLYTKQYIEDCGNFWSCYLVFSMFHFYI